MKEKITLTFLLLLIGIFSVITNVNASTDEAPPTDESRTEDDGWVEGDYEGSLEEQEEQAQEDWEDAGRPGENDNDDDDNDNDYGRNSFIIYYNPNYIWPQHCA